jgi:hypothetical protein
MSPGQRICVAVVRFYVKYVTRASVKRGSHARKEQPQSPLHGGKVGPEGSPLDGSALTQPGASGIHSAQVAPDEPERTSLPQIPVSAGHRRKAAAKEL